MKALKALKAEALKDVAFSQRSACQLLRRNRREMAKAREVLSQNDEAKVISPGRPNPREFQKANLSTAERSSRNVCLKSQQADVRMAAEVLDDVFDDF